MEAGNRHSRMFDSPKDARRFELELELGVADKTPTARQSPTFEQYARHWVETYCKSEKAESQWQRDLGVITMHLLPVFGGTKLVNLRRGHLLEAKDQMQKKTYRGKDGGKPLSTKTINNVIVLAKKIMATALERDLIPANPFLLVKQGKLPTRKFAYWTSEERDAFLVKARPIDPEFTDLVLVACHTGLRLGELAALTSQDLDFRRKMIHVGKTFDVNLGKLMPTTKGKTAEDVPMNRLALETLIPLRFKPETFDKGLFWSARKRLARLCKKTETRNIRFHDLRHTFASSLAMAGVDLMTIQKLMRHKSYQMTLRYAHLHPSYLEGATEVLCPQPARRTTEEVKSGGPRGT